MADDPTDPNVRDAYEDLARQTRNQYDALIDEGFEFDFYDSDTDPYDGNPYNAMRDLRGNKRMSVYGGVKNEGSFDARRQSMANSRMSIAPQAGWRKPPPLPL